MLKFKGKAKTTGNAIEIFLPHIRTIVATHTFARPTPVVRVQGAEFYRFLVVMLRFKTQVPSP
jgi:hypothetical protein